MQCYCTKSKHHDQTQTGGCNPNTGVIKCSDNVEHCIIGITKSSTFQSCWEWPNRVDFDCPSNEGVCFYVKNNRRNRACCCKGQLCNYLKVNMTNKQEPSKFKFRKTSKIPLPLPLPQSLLPQASPLPSSSSTTVTTIHSLKWSVTIGLLAFLILLILVLLLTLYRRTVKNFVYKRKRRIITTEEKRQNNIKTKYKIINSNNDFLDTELSGSCKKIRQIGIGRFGQIWLAHLGDNNVEVAVKLFSTNNQGYKSWKNEVIIYSILKTKENENVLKFYGADKITTSGYDEYMLVLDYHHNGSLFDYLTLHTVNWQLLLKLCRSIVIGINHIHCFSSTISIAHCDIKTKNILLKNDLSACLADFGLSISQSNRDKNINNQVGTCHYMAPEILQGSVNLTLPAFLQVDIYSMSLVFWEILNRCQLPDYDPGPYRQPFEDNLPSGFSLVNMRQLVSVEKYRPKLLDIWLNHQDIRILCDTIEECWDDDPDARLSADCVIKRLNNL